MNRVSHYIGLRILLLLLAGSLSACAGIDLDTGFDRREAMHAQIIDQQQDLYPEINPLALDDEIRALLAQQIPPRATVEQRVAKLQELLYAEEYLNIQYSDEKTHTASEVFRAREGNCLSVMNLFVAMARHVGVDANFQTVRVRPSWDRRGDLLVISQHINATGRLGVQRRFVVDFTPEIALQQLTANIVSDQQARALYFNNLGVEAMVIGELDQAIRYFKNGLFLDPGMSIGWNNIGAAYKHQGQMELAEYSYQMAFNADDNNASAINNLAKLYRNQGRTRLATEYEQAISRVNELNPYYHFAVGSVAYGRDDLDAARLAFRRALRLKEVEPDFYLALAQVYRDLGYTSQAEELVQTAQSLLAQNAEIYRPSGERLRVIDSRPILREGSPGVNIILN
jgi:tetratricopeptide (TPR) repeat protein